MAGGHGDYHAVKIDPAVERWQGMHSTMYERFRMTSLRTRQVVVLVFAVPVLTYEAMSYSNFRWNWRGKRNGESILRNAPESADAGKQ